MQSTPVSGGVVVSDVLLIGQAPGPRELVLQRRSRILRGILLLVREICGLANQPLDRQFTAAVCDVFPGKLRAAVIVFLHRMKFAIARPGWMKRSKSCDRD
jgi:hypothetical protein